MYSLLALLALAGHGAASCMAFVLRRRRLPARCSAVVARRCCSTPTTGARSSIAARLVALAVLVLARATDRRALIRDARARLRRRARAVPALAADAALPGPAHRRAVGERTDLRHAAEGDRRRRSTATASPSCVLLGGGAGLARAIERRRGARARGGAHRAACCSSARCCSRGLRRRSSPGVGLPLLRRVRRAAAARRRRRALRTRAGSGSWRSAIVVVLWLPVHRDQAQEHRPARRARVAEPVAEARRPRARHASRAGARASTTTWRRACATRRSSGP